jgi:transcriptional regulator with XRE-family HTH domain
VITSQEIRSARERAGLTQQQLGELVGVGLRTVGNWERGETVPRNREAALRHVLADHLGDASEPATLRAVADAEIVAEVARRMSRTQERTGETGARNAAPTTTAVSATATTEAINAVLERPREQLRRDLELAAKRSGSTPQTRVREYRDVINRYMSEADDALASLFARDVPEDQSDAV